MLTTEECSLTDEAGHVLWTRCLTCGAALLSPSKVYRGTCRNGLACFLRFYRNHVRSAWRHYRAPK